MAKQTAHEQALLLNKLNEHEGVYMVLPLNLLKIHPVLQRDINMRKVREMRNEGIDPMALQPLTVSFRDGEYLVVDGQHRYTALKLEEYKTAPCRVFEGKTLADEAKAFVKIQTSNYRMTALQVFHRKLAYNDPDALAIKETAEKYGLVITNKSRGHKDYRHNELGAIGMVEGVYKEGGVPALEAAFNLILTLWRDEESVLEGRVIMGAHIFLTKYKSLVDMNEVIRKLKSVPLASVLKRAHLLAEIRSGNAATNIAASILYFYNSGRRTRRLPNLFLFDE